MTGAAIVRWESGGAAVLAVHGAFDGASAWALRNGMDEASCREFIVDLTHAVEACDFAAVLLAAWARQRPDRRLSFRAGSAAHVTLLRAHGLEVEGGGEALAPAVTATSPRSAAPGVVA
jgi:hypothetical protein